MSELQFSYVQFVISSLILTFVAAVLLRNYFVLYNFSVKQLEIQDKEMLITYTKRSKKKNGIGLDEVIIIIKKDKVVFKNKNTNKTVAIAMRNQLSDKKTWEELTGFLTALEN